MRGRARDPDWEERHIPEASPQAAFPWTAGPMWVGGTGAWVELRRHPPTRGSADVWCRSLIMVLGCPIEGQHSSGSQSSSGVIKATRRDQPRGGAETPIGMRVCPKDLLRGRCSNLSICIGRCQSWCQTRAEWRGHLMQVGCLEQGVGSYKGWRRHLLGVEASRTDQHTSYVEAQYSNFSQGKIYRRSFSSLVSWTIEIKGKLFYYLRQVCIMWRKSCCLFTFRINTLHL